MAFIRASDPAALENVAWQCPYCEWEWQSSFWLPPYCFHCRATWDSWLDVTLLISDYTELVALAAQQTRMEMTR